MNTFVISAFRPVDHPDLSAFLSRKYETILKNYGVCLPEAFTNDAAVQAEKYCVVVRDRDADTICGSLRFYVSKQGADLPIQYQFRPLDPGIDRFVNAKKRHGMAQISALWVTKKGIGLSSALLAFSALLHRQLAFRSIISFCAPHTYQLHVNLGFTPVHFLENSGVVYFPDDRYLSRLAFLDICNLHHATPEMKKLLENTWTAPVYSTAPGSLWPAEIQFDFRIGEDSKQGIDTVSRPFKIAA